MFGDGAGRLREEPAQTGLVDGPEVALNAIEEQNRHLFREPLEQIGGIGNGFLPPADTQVAGNPGHRLTCSLAQVAVGPGRWC